MRAALCPVLRSQKNRKLAEKLAREGVALRKQLEIRRNQRADLEKKVAESKRKQGQEDGAHLVSGYCKADEPKAPVIPPPLQIQSQGGRKRLLRSRSASRLNIPCFHHLTLYPDVFEKLPFVFCMPRRVCFS